MKKIMHEIHEEVLEFLLEKREKDPKLLFTLRQINRGNRLDKGYWFLGGDNYLAISFWRGKDGNTKSPRIFFQINIDGSSSLEVHITDIKNANDYFRQKLFNDLGITYEQSPPNKPFETKDYIESLDSFISNEKKIIDDYINDFEPYQDYLDEFDLREDISKTNAEQRIDLDDYFGFLYADDFDKQLLKIERYRKLIHLDKKNRNDYIKSIRIKNFDLIKDLEIKNLNEKNKWVFLTGENGAGKSTILKALVIGLCQNYDFNTYATDDRHGIFEINIEYVKGNNKASKFKVVPEIPPSPKEQIPAGICAYGPIRIMTDGSNDSMIDQNLYENFTKSKMAPLFYPISILKDFSDNYPLEFTDSNFKVEISDVISNLMEILPTIYKIDIGFGSHHLDYYEVDDDGYQSKHKRRFEELPSGTRSLSALVLDMLLKLNSQQPEVGDIADYQGIVLIDEIDIHLHPKLQVRLIQVLSETFPKIQFIVTTHSPIPLLGAPKNSVFITVKKNHDRGIYIERWDKKIPINKLLPNAILTSPIFDLESLMPLSTDLKDIRTEDNFEDAFFNYMLQKEVDKLVKKDN